jgi:hypothetical protein
MDFQEIGELRRHHPISSGAADTFSYEDIKMGKNRSSGQNMEFNRTASNRGNLELVSSQNPPKGKIPARFIMQSNTRYQLLSSIRREARL